MRLSIFVLLLCATFASAQPKKNPNIADTEPLTPEAQRKTFKLPPGFVIELVAAEPKVKKPINIAFDAKGRLWVTESVEYPFAAKDRPGKDSVTILSDFAANGLAQKAVKFADDLNIPIGVLPHGKGALVYSIPNIWYLEDTDGDGKADTKKVLTSGYGFKDTHGMTGEFQLGFDGWIYCCHGFSNNSSIKSQGTDAITLTSGNTYRIKADGSRLEQFTFGQVNPFGLAFDPLGCLYSADCHTRPIYQLLRGGSYPSFGKPHDGLGFAPEMVTHSHGSTAISGVAYYSANQYPREFQDNLFVGNVVTHRINRDQVVWKGGSVKGVEMPDFVSSSDPWFRPVDIKLGPDGALYVADFYNRIIGHYEVPLDHPGRDREKGRIWRIVYRGVDGKNPLPPLPDLTSQSPKMLATSLADPNLAVRLQAAQLLVEQGKDAIPVAQAIARNEGPQKDHALWVLQRLNALPEKLLIESLQSNDLATRAHVSRILVEQKDPLSPQVLKALESVLANKDLASRCAVEALGRHPSSEALDLLLKVRASVPNSDNFLVHATRLAIRDQLRSGEVWAKLDASKLPLAEVRAIADVCPGLRDAASAKFLTIHLEKNPERSAGELGRFVQHAARFGNDDIAVRLASLTQTQFSKEPQLQGVVLKALSQGLQEGGKVVSPALHAQVEKLVQGLLASDIQANVQLGAELTAAWKVAGVQKQLLALAAADRPLEQRKLAVSALFAVASPLAVTTFSPMLAGNTEPLELRQQIAAALATTNTPDAQNALVKALQNSPASLQTAIALGMASSGPGGEKLLEAVAQGKASPRLLQDPVVQNRLKQAKIAKLDDKLQKLTAGLPPANQRIADLLKDRTASVAAEPGDVKAGLAIFTKTCAACHQIANQGAKLAPQLDGIGLRGVDRILEDVLDPNRNVDQAFRATSLVLTNGQIVSGLFLRQDGEILVVADAQGKEVRVPAKMVEERTISQLSPMPSNISEQLNDRDFRDLIAFLLSQKQK